MQKIVRLTENDLQKIVKKILSEQKKLTLNETIDANFNSGNEVFNCITNSNWAKTLTSRTFVMVDGDLKAKGSTDHWFFSPDGGLQIDSIKDGTATLAYKGKWYCDKFNNSFYAETEDGDKFFPNRNTWANQAKKETVTTKGKRADGNGTVVNQGEVLGLGSKGELIKKIQYYLAKNGYFNDVAKDTGNANCETDFNSCDGRYGMGTFNAVKDYQTQMKLQPDGQVGYQTFQWMKSAGDSVFN